MGWLSKLLHRSAPAPAVVKQAPPAPPTEPYRLRRWESAQTNRLNEAHWQGAHQSYMSTINADLWLDLPMLRARCTYEAHNNPFVEGVIDTHCTDLIGPDGPTLQVQSDSDDYNRALEQVWRDWFRRPDINGVLSGAEIMRLWIRMLWTAGEYLTQIVTDRTATGPVQMRLLDLHPTRLMSPPAMGADPLVVLGIRRTREGKPQQYFIAEPSPFGAYTLSFTKWDPIPPDFIIHQFKVLEPGQARGVPWLASSLPTVADLRDYDAQVLDAARAAADQATYLTATGADVPFYPANECAKVERRTIRTMPPGWDVKQMTPSQPAQNYVQYRGERLRELGRPVNMPLMTIRLGSEDHNYSSARFDNKVYQRGLNVTQGWISGNTLGRLVMEVAREAELARAIPRRPKKFSQDDLAWTWPAPATVDLEKELAGYLTGLEIGAMDLSEVAAKLGTDIDTLIARRKRTMQALIDAGLPPAPFWEPGSKVPSAPANAQDPGQPASTAAPASDEPPKKKKGKKGANQEQEVAIGQ